MKYFYIFYCRHLIILISFFIYLPFSTDLNAQINFSQSTLNYGGITNISGATSMEFGPDGRLYIADYPGNDIATGLIKILTINRNGPTSYVVTAAEILDGVSTIPNHNDDGAPADAAINGKRQVTGLTVVGTAANPIIYVTSSDVRIGGGTGTGQKDVGLDTNSGVITRMTWTGSVWEVVDIVRGLPRSEENHATNGLEFATINGNDYLIVASGGFTNAGAPSSNFALITEYALASAVLSVDLTELNKMPTLIDNNGRNYIYDLPTLDDPTRPNANGIIDPNTVGYNGVDEGDPWGGNDGLNQAKLVPNGPVQIFSPGYRNTYDLVLTQSGALYVTDNGANGGWGGFPENEGTANVTNNYNPAEPGSSSSSNGEQVDNKDHLELVTADIENYTFGSFYGGHPNPIRANPPGAGLYTDNNSLFATGTPIWRTQLYDPDGSTPGSTTDPNVGLPADWPPVPVSMANFIEGDWRGPSVPNPDGPNDNPIVIWSTNTNGITEYTASNFNNAMKGNLLATHSGGNLHRVQLNANGTSQELTQNFLSGIGGFTLGITANADDEVFPGTIWAGTINGIIAIFEPQDVVNCILPDEPAYDPLADYDSDGYSNQDEIDNGTDYCNGGSQPNDFDKVLGAPLVSDLNDLDDDGDGIPDALDPMQLGNPLAVGSQAFSLPIYNDLFIDQQGLGGIFGLGLTGLMNNGDTGLNWLNWLDDRDQGPNPNDVLGGAVGLMTSHMTSGTALGSINTQEKGYQYGVRVGTSTGPFTVTGAMIGFTGELRLYGNTAAEDAGELGYQIGDGTQSNYIKFVVTVDGFLALQEINDVPQVPITFNLPVGSRPTDEILFHFVVNPSNGQVNLEYQIDGGARETLGSITAQGSILDAIQQLDTDLIVGFIGTSGKNGVELEGTWDFLNVVPENILFAQRINAGGPETLYNDDIFTADQNFVGGQTYVNSSAQVPELYKTERSSPSQIFSYNFPLDNGDYTVILHFAEIYWGATGGGPSGVGNRIFDVSIEGNQVLNNYDINADVGPETVVTKSFFVTVTDGLLNIDFSSLAEDGGVDQPKVSAIEVLGNNIEGVPIVVNPIADQTTVIGQELDGSLAVVASGGDGNLNYSAVNLPPGLFIEPTNGQIGGTVLESASLTDPYIVTITVDDNDGISTDAETISFIWTIIDDIVWIDKSEDLNYTARHENSFVQAGDKFYLMGGRESSQTVDIYDYTTNTWSSLINSAPFEFNHFQATEYQGLIWIIGAFKTNNFPSELPADHIWIFNPASNEWIQGSPIPSDRQRGSNGLSVYNDKFYISGGNTIGHDGGYVSWFDEYDPATGIWTPLVDAPRARDHFHSAVIGGKLYLAGGRLSGGVEGTFKPVIQEVDVYDFSTSTWSTLPANLPTPRAGASTVEFNNKLLVIGGEVENEDVNGVIISDALKITEEYDPGLGTWSRIADLNYKRHGTQAIVSGNGVFTLAGSPNKGGGNQKNMEYLGTDAPTGEPSVASIISVPSPVQLTGSVPYEIPVTISEGNTGVFVTSIELEGPDMDKFNILSGNLTNALLKANSVHTIEVEYIGLNGGETTNLVINHGVSGQEIIILEASSFALRINSGGPETLNNGEVFSADQNFVGGQAYVNSSAQVPDLYKTERSSPSQIFSYNFPLDNGDYTVILHFAEIYWGATGGGPSGVGNRIFDVSIEGNQVLNNYDINADVGPETVVTKSFFVTVTDGLLNIDFSSLAEDGGVDQPKVSAIEVFGDNVQGIPILVNPIADQTSVIGQELDGSLAVVASGGDGDLNYSAVNLPPGLYIESTNGQILGTVLESASLTDPYDVTITVDDSDDETTDAKTVSFLWNIIESAPPFALRINSGGPETLNNGEVFSADQNFVGGQAYVNSSAQVPELYKTERSSPAQTFSYNLPIDNGVYSVVLHFAEIYWGATGGGPSGEGNRIFDVSIEGSLVLDNYDINADVGPETVVTKSFMVTVSDGELNIDFSSLPEVGGIDQPKVSAISVFAPITYTYNGIWTPSDPNGVATSLDNIVIASGEAIISSNTFSNSVIVNPGAGLLVNTGITLTTINGIILESISNSYSSLILDGNIAGTVNYERYVNMIGSGTTGGNDLVTPPLSGQRFDDFAQANSTVLAASGTVRAFAPFNNAANPGVYENYDIVTDAAEILQAGSGFRAATVAGAPLNFSGTANTGNVNINIVSAPGTFGEWNLIGNPYSSYISIIDFLNHDETPGIKNIELLANASGIYGYDGSASNGWDVITLANAGTRLMAPGQGFFVAANVSTSLQFTPDMRTSGTSDDFIAGRNSAPTFLKLKAATDTKAYTTDIYFNENASLGLDVGYDAQVWGGDTSNFILYSHLVEDNIGMAIALQAFGTNAFNDLSIPLGVKSNAGQQLRFSINESTLPETVEVYLEDTMANLVTLLNTSDYVFTPNTNLNGTGRFYLRFTDNTLSLDDIALNGIHIYTNHNDKTIVVNGQLESLTNFELYDVQGRLVRKIDLHSNIIKHTVDVSGIASGIYVVKLKNNSQLKTQKVILK